MIPRTGSADVRLPGLVTRRPPELSRSSATQCAAVSTQDRSIRDPPQVAELLPLSLMKYGNWAGSPAVPPTIGLVCPVGVHAVAASAHRATAAASRRRVLTWLPLRSLGT